MMAVLFSDMIKVNIRKTRKRIEKTNTREMNAKSIRMKM